MNDPSLWVWVVAQGQVLDNPPLLREYFSFDFDDIIALMLAITGLVALFVTRRTSAKTQTTTKTKTETVDADVLGKFTELFNRITKLESELAETRIELGQALKEIGEMRKLEEFLQARLHEKDAEIRAMKKAHIADLDHKEEEIRHLSLALDAAKKRIEKLEDACRTLGFDLEQFNENNGF